MADEPKAPGAIPLPSADLINFRFDALEKAQKEQRQETKQQFDQLNHKLDYAVATFQTKLEANEQQKLNEKEHQDLWDAIKDIKDNMKWWATWVIGAAGAAGAVGYFLLVLIRGH